MHYYLLDRIPLEVNRFLKLYTKNSFETQYHLIQLHYNQHQCRWNSSCSLKLPIRNKCWRVLQVFPVAKNLSVTSKFTRAGITKFILMEYSCVRIILFIIHTTGWAPILRLDSYVIASCSSQRRPWQRNRCSECIVVGNHWTTMTRVQVFCRSI